MLAFIDRNFSSINTKRITNENQGMKKKINRYSLVISVGKYDVSIFHIELQMKYNCS
jgi:hypothetical protein